MWNFNIKCFISIKEQKKVWNFVSNDNVDNVIISTVTSLFLVSLCPLLWLACSCFWFLSVLCEFIFETRFRFWNICFSFLFAFVYFFGIVELDITRFYTKDLLNDFQFRYIYLCHSANFRSLYTENWSLYESCQGIENHSQFEKFLFCLFQQRLRHDS